MQPVHTCPTEPPSPERLAEMAYHVRLETAVRELLIEQGVLTQEDVDRTVAEIDEKSSALGAKLVARAWVDPDFKARLLADANAACAELGIPVGNTQLLVVENTEQVHNLIVCTLCSCYPRVVLGLPPDWYKSREYRCRAVREPRAVLREFGTTVAEGVTVRVHDSNADMRYLVLPVRPPGTEGLSEEELRKLVTRDSMVGVSLLAPPGA